MADDTPTRKLATIVALDVAGYSARTEADEARTTAEVAALRKVIEGIAAKHGGRVFNTAGDGFMLEFASSLAAVEAAHDLAAKCEPKVRVGVHVGDVVVQPNGDLLGHGVNVAARLMAKSDPGGALVSVDVRRMIRGPIADRLVSRGLMQLEKMAETIEAFAVAAPTPAIVARMTISAEPVLAVLPFDNLSDDREMLHFADGLAEEVLQALSNLAGIRVIARTSAFGFRDARKSEAAMMLRASHVLDGAVRKVGPRLRVNTQLMDVATGQSVWSARYDKELTSIFALQDDIAQNVARSLRTVFVPSVRRQVEPRAYELYLKVLPLRVSATFEDVRKAENLLEQVVQMAPDFAAAWALLGAARMVLLPQDQDEFDSPERQAALRAIEQALVLDPHCAVALITMANMKPAFGEYAAKLELCEQAMVAAPNDPSVLTAIANFLISVGRIKAALPYCESIIALNPMSPTASTLYAQVLHILGRTSEAIAYLDSAMKRQEPSLWTMTSRASMQFDEGRFDDCEAYVRASGLALDPEYAPLFELLCQLPRLQVEQRLAVFKKFLSPTEDPVLRLTTCTLAARFGAADLAFDTLISALESNRPMSLFKSNRIGAQRAITAVGLFSREAQALRDDVRFARVAARVGLVGYWCESGNWPDCSTQVPYDFKAECEKATHDLATGSLD